MYSFMERSVIKNTLTLNSVLKSASLIFHDSLNDVLS